MSNIKLRLLVSSLLGIVVLAIGLVINRPASGILEATELPAGDRNTPAARPDGLSAEDYSVVIKSQSASRTFSVELAETIEEQSTGLADRDRLEADRGMLFVFDPPAEPSFWMRGMRFNLDILWIADGHIIKIDRNLPAPARPDAAANLPTYQPSQPIDFVLEINAGSSAEFLVGDTVSVVTSQLN